VPAIKEFGRSSAERAATRQLLDDVSRARQLAIVNRTTVYMVFLPPNYFLLPSFATLDAQQRQQASRVLDKQLRGYALVTLRGVGDQPGQYQPRFLTDWTELPQGWFFPLSKFGAVGTFVNYTNHLGQVLFTVGAFERTLLNTDPRLPFPSADGLAGFAGLPYIAFDHQGQLVSKRDEFIPLARGTVDASRNATGDLDFITLDPQAVQEKPPGNSLETYAVVQIDSLTGRARLLQRELE
jgi:hypothetical protein